MMGENRCRFLEAFGEIEETYIEQALQPWEKQKDKTRTYHAGRKAACFFLIAALGVAGIFHSGVRAAISRFSTIIAEMLGLESDLTSYSEIINMSQTRDGITLALKEVLLCENGLLAAVEAESSEGTETVYVGTGTGDVTINGETTGWDSMRIRSDFPQEGIRTRYVLEYYSNAMAYADGTVEVNLDILAYRGENDNEGVPFTFSFTASGEELLNETLHMYTDTEIEVGENAVLCFHTVTVNKVASIVTAECRGPALAMDQAAYYLKAVDSLGNEVLYYMMSGTDGWYQFKNEDAPPSMDSEWIDFQLCKLDLDKLEKTGDAAEITGTTDETDVSESRSVKTEIIGGADGPTSIFLAGKSGAGAENESAAAGKENAGAEDAFEMEVSDVFRIDGFYMEPVGEKFRISPSKGNTTHAEKFYDVNGEEHVYRVPDATGDVGEIKWIEEGEDTRPDHVKAGDIYYSRETGYERVYAVSAEGSYMADVLETDGAPVDGKVGDTVELDGVKCVVTAVKDGKIMNAREVSGE